MDFKKGEWKIGEFLDFDLDKASDLLDDKTSNRIANNLKKQLGPGGFPKPGSLAQQMTNLNPNLHESYSYLPKRELNSRNQSKDQSNLVSEKQNVPQQIFKPSKIGSQLSKPESLITPNKQKLAGGGLPTPKSSQFKIQQSGSLDSDLMQSMTKRLTQLEQLNKSLRLEVKEKSLQINTQSIELETLRLAADKNSVKEVSQIIQERDQYKKQCQEMEKFLADYGLKWIGEDNNFHQKEGNFNAKAVKEELAFHGPAFRNNLPKEIDTEVLTRRIEELNFIAEKQRIVTNQYGMKEFKNLEPVQIFFFKNGLMIKGQQFCPYYSKQAQSILSDILDGYFPFDLKKQYPEGVPLEPVDLTDDTYTPEMLKDKSNPKFKIFQDLQQKNCNPLTKQQFLDQFPKNVISKGQIVPIREELEKRFKETGKIDVSKLNSNEPIEIPTEISLNEKDYQSSEIVTLRVRTETGKRTLIVKLLKTSKILEVYQLIDPYIEFNDKMFELRCKFPNKAFQKSEIQNLGELGLAPSSALVIQSVQ